MERQIQQNYFFSAANNRRFFNTVGDFSIDFVIDFVIDFSIDFVIDFVIDFSIDFVIDFRTSREHNVVISWLLYERVYLG